MSLEISAETKSVPQTGNFFLIVPPPFEALAAQEFLEKWPLFFSSLPPALKEIKGGIEWQGEVAPALELNGILKIPNRLLWRLCTFKCRDFPTLFRKMSRLPWRLFLAAPPEIEISAKKSRLNDGRRIKKAAIDGIAESFRRQAPKTTRSSSVATLYLHFFDDQCTVSLDTSGERLGIRHQRSHIGQAPLRENLAAALLYALRQHLPHDEHLLTDPMCGSGVFLLEGALFYRPNLSRTYAYQSLPATVGIKTVPGPQAMSDKNLFGPFQGFDRQEEMIQATEKHWTESDLSMKLIQLKTHDLFVGPLDSSRDSPSVMIINPPYGERLKLKNPKDFFRRLIGTLTERWNPDYLGIIIPRAVGPLSFPERWELLEQIPFSNGGISVRFEIRKKRVN